jgi:hypothetical protein
MRPGPLTIVTQRLRFAQDRLQLLTRDAMNRRRTPDGFSWELHRERAHELLLAEFECWHLSAFLPDRAANDPQPMPGAA